MPRLATSRVKRYDLLTGTNIFPAGHRNRSATSCYQPCETLRLANGHQYLPCGAPWLPETPRYQPRETLRLANGHQYLSCGALGLLETPRLATSRAKRYDLLTGTDKIRHFVNLSHLCSILSLHATTCDFVASCHTWRMRSEPSVTQV